MSSGTIKIILITVLAVAGAAILPGAPGRCLGAEGAGSDAGAIEILERELEKRDRVIDHLLQRIETIEKEVNLLRGKEAPEQTLRIQPAPEPPASPHPAVREEVEDEERLAQAALERVLIQRSSILLPPGTLEVEPGFTYVHSSADNIIIDGVAILDVFGIGLVVGEIISERVRRDILIPALTFRLGLPWDSQAELRIPYRYETERVISADFAEQSRRNSGFGDLELAFNRQLFREKGLLPDVVGGIRWRTTTGKTPADELPLGTGFHGLQFLASAVKIRDPVALFGGLAYTLNFADTRGGVRIDPGDTWGFNLGLALVINPETSINFQWEHRFTDRTELKGLGKVPGTALTVGVFRLGLTYVLSRHIFLDFGVGIGLTRDSPDVVASVAVPIRFPQMFFSRDH